MLRAAITFAILAATSAPAYPCINQTLMHGDEAVRQLVRVEAYLDAGNYRAAKQALDVYFHEDHLKARARDAEMVISLRIAPRRVAKRAIEYFAARSKAAPNNVRYRAWLAEAYAVLNKREEALAILDELQRRDLMPDGFAWVTLAKLSDGPDVDAHLETCRKRAKTKSICVIPTAARKPPAERRRSYRMRLPG
jgi:tetratricopeptide (TPR) repeat protein